MEAIFLDIDGVMVSEDSVIFNMNHDLPQFKFSKEAAATLNSILCTFPEARLVISSTWRLGQSCADLRGLLIKEGVLARKRYIDKTPVLNNRTRGAEINQWLIDHRQHDPFVIIDDDKDMDDLIDKLVQINPKTGMTLNDYDRVVKVLEERII